MQRIISGYVSKSDYYGDNILIDGERITDILRDIVSEDGSIGKNLDKDSGLGKKKTIIYNCQMFAYFTKSECTVEEAQECLDVYLYTGEGFCECEGEYRGYSEWTITGFDITQFEIDGHNLISEFSSHDGEYVNFVINY